MLVITKDNSAKSDRITHFIVAKEATAAPGHTASHGLGEDQNWVCQAPKPGLSKQDVPGPPPWAAFVLKRLGGCPQPPHHHHPHCCFLLWLLIRAHTPSRFLPAYQLPHLLPMALPGLVPSFYLLYLQKG